MNVIVDTSVWIFYFRKSPHAILEEALQNGRVFLTPIVFAELLSGEPKPSRERVLLDFLLTLPLAPTPVEHWVATGRLRCRLAAKGVNVSLPDAHVAQTALDAQALLLTRDKIFEKIASHTGLKCHN